tara:strand:- start:1357 stop:1935 length:579 start_codon:yes stop_codon:yes gene_type:complete
MSPPGGVAHAEFYADLHAAYYADLCCADLDERVTLMAGRLALGEAKPSTHACISGLIPAVRQRVEALTPETAGREDTLRLGERVERLATLATLAATTINTEEQAMSRVRIISRHPISNPGGPTCWDGKVHEYSGSLLDVAALGEWLTSKVRIKFCYDPGYSRVEDGKCIFFTRRYMTGMHCMWVEPVTAEED